MSVIVTAPFRTPAAVGTKVMVIEQLPAAATLVPQVFVCVKSPEAETLVMFRAAFPVFVRVTVCEAATPTSWLPKITFVLDKLTAGPGGAPVPVSTT